MLFGSRILALAAGLAIGFGIPASTNALTLAELIVPGASFDAGNGATFSNFAVKIRGRGLSTNLSDYGVVPTDDGFALVGAFNDDRRGGKIKLTYDVTGLDLRGAALAVVLDGESQGFLSVKDKIRGDRRIGKLRVSSRSGNGIDEAMFDVLPTLAVMSKIKIRGDYFQHEANASIRSSVTATLVPEPTTALMLAAGLGGLAAAGRRRSR